MPPREPPPSSPLPDAPDPARAEMRSAPPFLTWRAIYTIVLAALGVQVVLYAALTAIYR